MVRVSSYGRDDQSSPPIRTWPACAVTSSTTIADRPTSADVPLLSSGGCLIWRNPMGRTTTIPARDARMNAPNWSAPFPPAAPEVLRRRSLGLEVAAGYTWASSVARHVEAYQLALGPPK